MIVRVKLRLYPGEDDDLIVFFDSIPFRLRATMVKQALRPRTLSNEELTADDDGLSGVQKTPDTGF